MTSTRVSFLLTRSGRPLDLRIRHRRGRRRSHPHGRLGRPSAAVGLAPLRPHRARPLLHPHCCHISVLPSHHVPGYPPSTLFPRGAGVSSTLAWRALPLGGVVRMMAIVVVAIALLVQIKMVHNTPQYLCVDGL